MTPDDAISKVTSHLSDEGFPAVWMPLLVYLQARLIQAGKSSAKANAVQTWIDGMILAAALSPETLVLAEPPFSFIETVQECAAVLTEGA